MIISLSLSNSKAVSAVSGGGTDCIHTECFRKKTYTSDGNIIIERGGTNLTECFKNAALSSLRNPACKLSHPPGNTVCYDCCTGQRLVGSPFCNTADKIDPHYMPSFMKFNTSNVYLLIYSRLNLESMITSVLVLY